MPQNKASMTLFHYVVPFIMSSHKERLKDVDYLKSLIEDNLIGNNEFNILLNDNVIDSKTYDRLTK